MKSRVAVFRPLVRIVFAAVLLAPLAGCGGDGEGRESTVETIEQETKQMVLMLKGELDGVVESGEIESARDAMIENYETMDLSASVEGKAGDAIAKMKETIGKLKTMTVEEAKAASEELGKLAEEL